MPTITIRRSLAAGERVDNLLTGSQFERLPYSAQVQFGINGDANGHEVLVDVYSGQDVLLENAPLNAQARVPVNPDDFTLMDVAGYMEQLKIRAANTGAGAHVVFASVIITPI